jgi:4-hydroxy-4-methyl-2-oxoglutarate aldolase
MDTQTLAERTEVDTGTLSDALDRLGLAGAIWDLTLLTGPARVLGRAVTVRLDVVAAQPAARSRHLCTAAVETGGNGSVVVVAHPGGHAAGWGGLLSLAATLRGINGVIVDGPCRDIDQARELGFPIVARSATPVTARGRIAEVSWNEPIDIAGVSVHPGDLVLADCSGVVFIDQAYETEVLAEAAAIADREAEITRQLLDGAPVSVVMGGQYERLVDTVTPTAAAR